MRLPSLALYTKLKSSGAALSGINSIAMRPGASPDTCAVMSFLAMSLIKSEVKVI